MNKTKTFDEAMDSIAHKVTKFYKKWKQEQENQNNERTKR